MPILGKTKEKILLKLHESPSYGYKISKDLDIPITGIYQHINDLVELGLIERCINNDDNKKTYMLTNKGMKLVELFKK